MAVDSSFNFRYLGIELSHLHKYIIIGQSSRAPPHSAVYIN